MSLLKDKILYRRIISCYILSQCHQLNQTKDLIIYIQQFKQMGPKKKAANPTQKKQVEADNQAKPVAQQPKKETKQVKEPPQVSETKPAEPKKQISKPEEPKPAEPKIVRTQSQTQKKINLAEGQKLSQAQLLQRRKTRFNLVGTEVDAQEAERIKKQRLQKFGSMQPQSKEDLEKRRQKFGKPGSINLNQQDQTLLAKRQQKFGGTNTTSQVAEDPSILEERRKKFGSNDVNLDEQIRKGKQRNRNSDYRNQHHRRNEFKRSRPHNYDSRDKYNSNSKRFRR